MTTRTDELDQQALTNRSAFDIAQAIANGELRAVDVVDAHLRRVELLDPSLNAICTVNPRARDDAYEVDERRKAGQPSRLLEGVPVVVKDNIEAAGMRTTYGSRLSEDFVPLEDAIVVARLKAAGAVLIGKTNTPEFAADINTTNFVFGQTRNPWDINVTPGGSSGGTAAAIAARFAPIGIGTDLGGSIRIPASYNGLVGLRPSPGRVPVFPQEFAWDTLVPHVQGPLARHVVDLALVLDAIAGPDERDPTTLPRPLESFHAGLAAHKNEDTQFTGGNVAYAGDFAGLVPLDAEVDRLVRSAVSSLTNIGLRVTDDAFDASRIRDIRNGTRAFNVVARLAGKYDGDKERMTRPVLNQIESAIKVDVRAVTRAERLRTEHWHAVREFLERYDFIACPTVGAPPFRLDEPLPTHVNGVDIEHYYDVILTTYIFSVTGLPSISLPCGLTEGGLPVGLQLIAPRHREDRLLALAHAYESVNPGLFRVPDCENFGNLKPVSDALSMPGMPGAVPSTPPG